MGVQRGEVEDPMAVGDSATPAVAKLSISGAALASLLHRCAAAAGNCDGLLFGRASRLPAPPSSLSDYDDHAAALPAPALSISVSGHCSLSHPSSLSDPLGRFQPPSPPSASATVGFFSSRRHTALRPSMREIAVAHSLPKSLAPTHPLLFLLVSPSSNSNHSTHSYDYRAFLLTGARLVPASLAVVNVGPGFRDQYHSFTAESPLPWLPPPQPSSPATPVHTHTTIGEQTAVDAMVDGFGLQKLQGIISSAAGQEAEMDDMYAGMLRRLEKLAREVEKSNLRVLEQVVFLTLHFLSVNAVHIVISCKIGSFVYLIYCLNCLVVQLPVVE
jgi:BRISC complex subunit Abro1